jgi:DNA-binding phage protein
MPLTRTFKSTIKARADRDPKFRAALLREAADCLLGGDWTTARALMRDYVKAASSYLCVAKAVGLHEKSVVRMFGAGGNPNTRNLVRVLAYLQKREGVRMTARLN